ncbi:MAG TPA: hypothetical protein VEW93_04460 [Acidimicrobiales bacterium]|nr:hypothetical protein [Acidimicrobiales bacterium]
MDHHLGLPPGVHLGDVLEAGTFLRNEVQRHLSEVDPGGPR